MKIYNFLCGTPNDSVLMETVYVYIVHIDRQTMHLHLVKVCYFIKHPIIFSVSHYCNT